MTSTTYQVTGMTCEHCVRAVTEEIEGLHGVSAVTVALVPGGESAVTVTSDAPLTPRRSPTPLTRPARTGCPALPGALVPPCTLPLAALPNQAETGKRAAFVRLMHEHHGPRHRRDDLRVVRGAG